MTKETIYFLLNTDTTSKYAEYSVGHDCYLSVYLAQYDRIALYMKYKCLVIL